MILRRIGAAAAGVCLGSMLLPTLTQARPLGTVDWMPFFGLPYPNGFVYHPPRMECYSFEQIFDPLEGYKIVPIWICGAPPVRSAY